MVIKMKPVCYREQLNKKKSKKSEKCQMMSQMF